MVREPRAKGQRFKKITAGARFRKGPCHTALQQLDKVQLAAKGRKEI
jgi:hypothetical protein